MRQRHRERAVALVVGPEARDDEVGTVHERDRLEQLAQAAAVHDLAEVEDDPTIRREPEPLRQPGAPDDLGRRRLGVAVRDHRRVPDDGVDGPAQDPREDRRVRVADGHDRIGGPREAALMAPEELLPRAREAGHPTGLAVDVVRVVDDPATEAIAQRDRLAERDDALGLPHVEGPDLLGDAVGPCPRHQQVPRRLDGAAERLADPSTHRGHPTRRLGRRLGQARRREEGQRLRLAHADDTMAVTRLGRGGAWHRSRDDRHVVAGLGQRHRRLPRPGVGHVGIVDEDRDAGGGHARTVAHRRPSATRPGDTSVACIIRPCPRWKP